MAHYPQCILCDSEVTEACMKRYAGKKPPCARDIVIPDIKHSKHLLEQLIIKHGQHRHQDALDVLCKIIENK